MSSFSRCLREGTFLHQAMLRSPWWCPCSEDWTEEKWKGDHKMGQRLKTETFVLWLGWRLSCPHHWHLATCQDVFNLHSSEATTWLENGAQEAYHLEISLEVDLSLEWIKRMSLMPLIMCHLFMLTCASVSFKWLWYGLTAIQREKVFFSSLYLYIFFLLLIEHIVCGHVCVSVHVCGCTYMCVHIHLEAREHLWASFLRLCPSFFPFLGMVSNWPGTGKVCKAGWTVSPGILFSLPSQEGTTMPGFFFFIENRFLTYNIFWLHGFLKYWLWESNLGPPPCSQVLRQQRGISSTLWIFFFFIHSLKVPCNCFSLALEGTNKKKMWYNLVATRDWSLNSIIPVLSLGTLTLSANIHKISS